MVGKLVLDRERRRGVALERAELLGLPVLRAGVAAPAGLREDRLARRVDKAARLLAQRGVRRVLAPVDCPWWPWLDGRGLAPVDPEPLVQAMAVPLALGALARQGRPPEQGTVLLAGKRISRALFQTAVALCPMVRRLAIQAPDGGEELADYLWEEFGMPVLGEGHPPHLTLCFAPGYEAAGPRLELWGRTPDLAGLRLDTVDGLDIQEGERLEILTLLWETGRLSAGEIVAI